MVRLPLSPPIVEAFQARHLDVAAGVRPQRVRPQLERQAATRHGVRVLDGHFMEIRQALGVPASRDGAATA